MDKQNLMPQAAQPVNRITTGQLPAELAELSEEVLQLHGNNFSSVRESAYLRSDGDCASCGLCCNACNCGACCAKCRSCQCLNCACSYDGDDAE